MLEPMRELWCERERISVLNSFVKDILETSKLVDWHLLLLSLVTNSVKVANMVLSAKKTSLL